MKPLNTQDNIPSTPFDDFKDSYVLVFDFTSMQGATENCHYPELVGEPLRLELNFTHPLENVTELIVLGERMSSVAVDKFVLLEKCVKMDNFAMQQTIIRILLLKFRYIGSFPLHYVPSLENDTFAIINTQPSIMQCEHWTMIAKFPTRIVFWRLSWM